MQRRNFIKKCSLVGASCFGISLLIAGCKSVPFVNGIANTNKIQINKSEFIFIKKDKKSFRKYVVVRVEKSDFPIVLYRFSETEYSALLLRCTHQNFELNVNGDLLTCSAHGSEFSNKGEVVQGPADRKLKSFPVSVDGDFITIGIL